MGVAWWFVVGALAHVFTRALADWVGRLVRARASRQRARLVSELAQAERECEALRARAVSAERLLAEVREERDRLEGLRVERDALASTLAAQADLREALAGEATEPDLPASPAGRS
jgi:hypothetical protein